MFARSDSTDRLRKYRLLLRAMTTVIALADRLGHEPLIAAMDVLKTAVAREAAARCAGR